MESFRTAAITPLLASWNQRGRDTQEDLALLVYPEIRRLARLYLRGERSDHTLQATDLAHEAYLRLAQLKKIAWTNRTHFFATAARMIRRVLVDHARNSKYAKRGGNMIRIPIDKVGPIAIERPTELLDLEAALTRLSMRDPMKAWIVELRFFGGLTISETASSIGASTATVNRHWKMAKAWLYRELSVSSQPAI